jgi:4-carboxymuconolactone decarboxylase
MKRALENGITKDEIIATITHLAFYAGWPPAMTALQIARKVFAEAAG